MQDRNGSGLRRPARAAAALTLAAALLAGCAASPAQSPATGETGAQATARPVKTEFTREELLEDFDAAWQIIQEDYIFMSVLEERGMDPQQYYEAARGVMEERAETLEDLSEWMTYLFGNMERRAFSHLSVASLSTYQVYAETYTATPEAGAWDAAIHDVVTAPQTVAIYDWIASNSETLPNMLSGPTSYPVATVSYDEAHKAACFYFPTFNNATVERDAGIVQDALMELYGQGKAVENIVFDITGNGGGDTAYWANNIVAPFGGTYEFREPRFIRDTPRTRWWYQNADLHPVEEYAAEYPLPDFRAALPVWRLHAAAGTAAGKTLAAGGRYGGVRVGGLYQLLSEHRLGHRGGHAHRQLPAVWQPGHVCAAQHRADHPPGSVRYPQPGRSAGLHIRPEPGHPVRRGRDPPGSLAARGGKRCVLTAEIRRSTAVLPPVGCLFCPPGVC